MTTELSNVTAALDELHREVFDSKPSVISHPTVAGALARAALEDGVDFADKDDILRSVATNLSDMSSRAGLLDKEEAARLSDFAESLEASKQTEAESFKLSDYMKSREASETFGSSQHSFDGFEL